LQHSKDDARGKALIGILDELRQGTVIVEGAHDVRALAYLGVPSIPFSRVSGPALGCSSRKVYLLMDNDRGGAEKSEKLRSRILELGEGYVINEVLGKRMLRMLNATSVEQIKGPIDEALKKSG
jgi:5S rRNA maturation endonuclease (ribonuclease M5)